MSDMPTTLEGMKQKIVTELMTRRYADKPVLIVRDWGPTYYWGPFDGVRVNTKVLKDEYVGDPKLFTEAAKDLERQGTITQYNHLTERWNGTTKFVALGIAGKEHEFGAPVPKSQATGMAPPMVAGRT